VVLAYTRDVAPTWGQRSPLALSLGSLWVDLAKVWRDHTRRFGLDINIIDNSSARYVTRRAADLHSGVGVGVYLVRGGGG